MTLLCRLYRLLALLTVEAEVADAMIEQGGGVLPATEGCDVDVAFIGQRFDGQFIEQVVVS